MFGNKETGVVTFSYDTKELFNDVGILSAYMTKNLATEKGSLMDEYAITDDEWDIYVVCLEQTVPNVCEPMLKMASGIEDAFDAGIEVDEQDVLEREPGTYVEFNINDNEAYNVNVLRLVDNTLRDCLKYGVLAEFYSTCTQADLYGVAHGKYMASMKLLNQRLFQLKKKPVITSY